MNDLLAWIATHQHRPPLGNEEFATVVSKLGIDLGSQLKSVYAVCNGASWMSDTKSLFRILSVEEIERARTAIYGKGSDDYGVPSVYAFFSYGDSDYVGIDIAREVDAGNPVVVDCWHESFAHDHPPPIIANNVFEFLARLHDSNSSIFWLK